MGRYISALVISGLLGMGGLAGCSDDDVSDRDTGTTQDTSVAQDTSATDDTGGCGNDAACRELVEKYVLDSGAVTGWVGAGVEAAYDDKAIDALINGHHDPYATEGTKGFVMQDYSKGAMTLRVEIWEMNSTASAKNMFDMNETAGTTEAGLTFEAVPNAAEGGIIADDQPNWVAYAYKAPYTLAFTASYATLDDKDTLKADTISFVQQQLANLP